MKLNIPMLTDQELNHRRFLRKFCKIVASKMDPDEFIKGYHKLLAYKALFVRSYGVIPIDIAESMQYFSDELQEST